MSKLYHTPIAKVDNYSRINVSHKTPQDFIYLLGVNLSGITMFEDGTDELLEQGAIILPRHYFIFVGTKDDELQYKPYEHNKYRIVVSTEQDIISSIDSIG